MAKVLYLHEAGKIEFDIHCPWLIFVDADFEDRLFCPSVYFKWLKPKSADIVFCDIMSWALFNTSNGV